MSLLPRRRRDGLRRRTGVACLASLLALAACRRAPLEAAPAAPVAADAASTELPVEVVLDGAGSFGPPPTITPARVLDGHVSRSPIRIRRLVYRFALRVHWGLGSGRADLAPPTAELHLDVAGGRLRARFVGNGFPVDDGSEVRLRSDEPGTYVFDGRGGRPVGTGQLAAWFQSGPGARTVELRVRNAEPDDPKVIELVCRLFGEWAGASIASVRRSCANAGLPTRFLFGPYRVDRTAEAYLDVPERSLRADHEDPPSGLVHEPAEAFYEDATLQRLLPSVDEPPERRIPHDEVPVAVERGLRVENRTGARALVTIDGVALGWLDPAEATTFPGIPAGGYVVGAMLPLGGSASRGRAYALPANVVLQR